MAGNEGGFLAGLRDSYENFVSSLEQSGVPSPRIVVPVVAVIIIVGLALLLLPNLFSSVLNPTQNVEFTLMSSQNTPVPGALGTLTAGSYSQLATSTADGKLAYKGVPKGQDLQLSVSAQGYPPKNGVFQNGDTITLSSATAPAGKSLKLNVLDNAGSGVESAAITLNFEDGSTMNGYTDAFGQASFDLTGVSAATAIAQITKPGFATATKSVSVSGGTVTIQLTADNSQKTNDAVKGDFIVKVSAPNGQSTQGVSVTLVDTYSSSQIAAATVDASGKADFPNLNFNTIFYVTASDAQGRFSNYEGSSQVTFTQNLQEQDVSMLVAKGAQDQITIAVKDDGGNALSGAQVNLYDQNTKMLYEQQSTDANGNARFTTSSANGKSYYVTAFEDGYLPNYLKNVHSGDSKSITLDSEKNGNFVQANVQVKDDTAPVADAQVDFFKADGFPLGIPSVSTAADGTAVTKIPLQFDGKNYQAYAVATVGNKAGRSDLNDVADGMTFSIAVQAPPANVTLSASDLISNQTISTASFSVIAPDNSIVQECQQAPCSTLLPPDVDLRVVATADGYLQSTTAPQSFTSGASTPVNVFLYPLSLSKKNSINFVGFFDRDGNSVVQLARAESYTAKFMVSLSQKGDAFAFFQAGDSPDLSAEPFQITGFKSAVLPKKSVFGQTTDTVCSPQQQTQPSTLKWLELDYSGLLGAVEVDVQFTAKQDAAAGAAANLLYRLGGATTSGSVPFTSPQDDDLLTQLVSQVSRDRSVFCTAKTSLATANVENSPMVCKDGLCSRIALVRDDGVKTSNNLNIQLGQQFNLNFDLFAPGQSIDSVSLAQDPSIEIISGSAGQLSMADQTFTASGTDKTSGTILVKGVAESSKIPLSLTVSFTGDKQPVILQRGISVTGKNSFQVSVSPKQASVGQSLRLEAIVLDSFGQPVPNAEVSLSNCDETAGSVLPDTIIQTGDGSLGNGRDGKYDFKFTPTTIGDVCLEASATGFQTQDVTPALSVSASDFISTDQQSISFTGTTDPGQSGAAPKQITVSNSLAGSKIKVQASINQECASLLTVIPSVKQSVSDSATFTISLTSSDAVTAQCTLSFLGQANPTTTSTIAVPVSINTQAPTVTPGPTAQCEPSNTCLTPDQSASFGSQCSAISGFACDSGKTCFVCGDGLQNIQAISLSVSNIRNDRQVFPLLLKFDPQFNDQFDLVWDQQFTTMLPVQNQPQFQPVAPQQPLPGYPQLYSQPFGNWYAGQYGSAPFYSNYYPFGAGGIPNSQLPPQQTGYPPVSYGSIPGPYSNGGYGGGYGGYNPNSVPYGYGVPSGFGQSCVPGVNSFVSQCPAGTTCRSTGDYVEGGVCVPIGGAYPGIYPGQGVIPPYCQNYVYNSQAAYGNYYSNGWYNQYSPGVPFGYPANCQYPVMCGNPQACGFLSYSGGQSSFYAQFSVGGNVPQACQYPYICSNPSACPQLTSAGAQSSSTTQSAAAQFKQVGTPVKVSVQLSRSQLIVSAVYQGDDYFFAGGQPATAKGTLYIRDSQGVSKKSIPITITLSYSGSIPTPTPVATTTVQPPQTQVPITPPPFFNWPFPTQPFPPQIPPECMQPYYPFPYGQPNPQQLQLPALPELDNMQVYANVFTGKGKAQVYFQPPQSGNIDCIAKTTLSGVTCSVGTGKTVTLDNSGKPISQSAPYAMLTANSPQFKLQDYDGKASFGWSQQESKKIDKQFSVVRDAFNPQKIQLFSLLNNPDSVIYSQQVDSSNCDFKGGIAKVTCGDAGITAETVQGQSGESVLTLQGLGDNQIREIPVVISKVQGNEVLDTGQSSGSGGSVKSLISFTPKLQGFDGANLLDLSVEFKDGNGGCNNCLNANWQNGQILLDAEYGSVLQQNPKKEITDVYVVHVILPQSAARPDFLIPVIVTTDSNSVDLTKPVIIAPSSAAYKDRVAVHVAYLSNDDVNSRSLSVAYTSNGSSIITKSDINADKAVFIMPDDGITVTASTKTNGKTVQSTKTITVGEPTEAQGAQPPAGKAPANEIYGGASAPTSSTPVQGTPQQPAPAVPSSPLVGHVGGGGIGENFDSTQTSFTSSDRMYYKFEIPVDKLPDGDFYASVWFYYKEKPAGSDLLGANDRAVRWFTTFNKKDLPTTSSGTAVFYASLDLSNQQKVIDANGNWIPTGKPAFASYALKFSIIQAGNIIAEYPIPQAISILKTFPGGEKTFVQGNKEYFSPTPYETYGFEYKGNHAIQFWTNANPRYFADFMKITVTASWTNYQEQHIDCFPDLVRISSCPGCPDIQRWERIPEAIGGGAAAGIGAGGVAAGVTYLAGGAALLTPVGWAAAIAAGATAIVGALWFNSFDAITIPGDVLTCHNICLKNEGQTIVNGVPQAKFFIGAKNKC